MHEVALLIGQIFSLARVPVNVVPSAYEIVLSEFATHEKVPLAE